MGYKEAVGSMEKRNYSTWLEIDLGAIRNNIRKIQNLCNLPVMAVVKANAYGHGLVEVSRAAQEAGAAWLGVARIEEAVDLRKAGNQGQILVLGYTPADQVPLASEYDVSLTIYDMNVAVEYSRQLKENRATLRVHVKVDTGMGRLGIFPEEGMAFFEKLHTLPGIIVEGVFTHFARADEPRLTETPNQIDRFDRLLSDLAQRGMRPAVVHASNSAGLLHFPEGRYDMVRAGIIVYGLGPSDEAPVPQGFLPALSLKSILTSVKTLPKGHGVGYNHRYITQGVERVGVTAIGYADGFRRRLGGIALVNGKRVPILGTVCMDQCILRLDEVPEAKIGDEVVLIGSQGEETISVDELAAIWGTINYEVVCAMATRVPRVYLE